eukprot:4564775-Ditylum_brightwellii.AAC.1
MAPRPDTRHLLFLLLTAGAGKRLDKWHKWHLVGAKGGGDEGIMGLDVTMSPNPKLTMTMHNQ